jgi:hypothetical protein
LKPNAQPRIVDELRGWRGNVISLEGEKVQDIRDDLHRDVIDANSEVALR